ncbi:ASCH domain-containing protein [Bradyrhizobium cenepequi]|uniref:ASCH domain-containing protein n=1 Tax=Bradyrhizobium cenepequi TaxID=2821403 RepID=UPI001CE27E60|nr:ASCH domain-containing protein [Bradyrhizobium cenepequi]MCA6108146.1 hypothetical protein [Bradyrhizobium cenepequi]
MLPAKCLSLIQPWAWAVVYGGKPIENRSWRDDNPALKFRGRVAIHASKGMTRTYYDAARGFMSQLGVRCPAAIDLTRGAIIGSVEIVDAVKQSDSPWFFGYWGFVLRNPEPCEPIPVVGQLGFFDWKRADIEPPAPTKWMLKDAERVGYLPGVQDHREVEPGRSILYDLS